MPCEGMRDAWVGMAESLNVCWVKAGSGNKPWND